MAVNNVINFYVYDKNLKRIAIVDLYSSLIWTDRYNECGEFELTLLYEKRWRSVFRKDYFCSIDFSDHWCIIEKLEIKKEDETAPMMIITGRSVESILERRIVLEKKEFSNASVQDSIKTLLNENIIAPENEKRKIENFLFSQSSFESITELTFTDDYDSDDLLSIISGICQEKHIGFRVTVNSSKDFVFRLYAGADRSKENNSSSYVIFSPFYDNLQNSDYVTSSTEYRNYVVISKDEDTKLNAYTTSSEPSGISRREIHLDATELKENKDEELTNSQLRTKAVKKLRNEHKIKTTFEGDIVPEQMYKYRTHYNTGDWVHFEDGYGNSQDVYISEVIISMDENGLTIIPTFEDIDW